MAVLLFAFPLCFASDSHLDELNFIRDNLYKSADQKSESAVPSRKQLIESAQAQTNFLKKRQEMLENMSKESEIEVVDLEGTYFGRPARPNSDKVSTGMAAPTKAGPEHQFQFPTDDDEEL